VYIKRRNSSIRGVYFYVEVKRGYTRILIYRGDKTTMAV
jgi:hypothetical protein